MRLALAIVRQAPAVAGVLFFGWPVMSLALFFLLDLWLTMTLRGALDLTGDRGGLAGNLAWLGSLFGAIVLVAAWEIGAALPAAEVARFTDGGWRDPWFLASLGLLLVAQAVDGARFRSRLRTRTARETEEDGRGHLTQWARAGLVAFGAAVLLPLAARFGQGAAAIVLLLAAVNVLAEAFPASLARLLD
ncbi:MAG: hypothetical protein ABW221_17310 [Vicinamibacteria bacterium]